MDHCPMAGLESFGSRRDRLSSQAACAFHSALWDVDYTSLGRTILAIVRCPRADNHAGSPLPNPAFDKALVDFLDGHRAIYDGPVFNDHGLWRFSVLPR